MRATLYVARGWRTLYVCSVCLFFIGFVGSFEAHPPKVKDPSPLLLTGARYKDVTLTPHRQRLPNAVIEYADINTPDDAMDVAVNTAIQQTVHTFTAQLPADPVVNGFVHQLRVKPRVDYASNTQFSVTVQTDVYHPIRPVETSFESWVGHGTHVEQPIADAALVKQLSKTLGTDEQQMQSVVGSKLAIGLLPNHKARVYASTPLKSFMQRPFKDVPLSQLPELSVRYSPRFYGSYPQTLSANDQKQLDRALEKTQDRQESTVDCLVDTCVALTFDDGPDPVYTPRVLDTLAAYGVVATFFQLGVQVDKHPELTARVAAAGHEIENHTYGHADLTHVPPAGIRAQIDLAQAAFARAGVQTKFLRPPYGAVNDTVRTSANMPIILWNVDAQEWRTETTAASIAASIISQARPGAILLLHDTKAISADALPTILEQLKAREYRFVTVQKLLGIDGSARGDFAAQ